MIVIDDHDVRSVAAAFDCTFGEEHAKFLKATSSCNLHACPGSGKTTLLVAKLALLARKWPWRDRGILVLSHTNVARREVEQRLAKEPSGARLLGYPHFVGTIQGFVDRFLALPFLRDEGKEAPRIDDELFAVRATSLFYGPAGWKNCRQARAYLKKRHQEGRPTISSLHYRGPDLLLAAEVGDLPGPNTPTTKQLLELKTRISNEAIFRYADMFAFAAASLKARPFLREALRRRFPSVFIDEMQDTSKDQDQFLDGIFGGAGIVLHKIGDMNQAIFFETATNAGQIDMAWANSIDLPQSQRLAPKLAQLVSPLAVVHPLKLHGNPKRKDRTHTVFLFDDETISGVLPAFGNLILREWPRPLPLGFIAKAVGFRRSPPEKRSIPASLSDYYHGFAPAPMEERPARTTLLEAVRHARRLVDVRGEFFVAHRTISDSLAQLVEVHEGARVTRRILNERCTDGKLDERVLRKLVVALLCTDCESSSQVWAEVTGSACDCLLHGAPSSQAKEYLAWEDAKSPPATTGKSGHIFVHRNDGREVAIEVTTIHAVKGETHDATIVLETQFHEHDVGLAVPLLLGKPGLKKTPRFIEHMKRLFVGTTRPKELLCLALHRAHATEEQLAALRDVGWSVDLLEKAAVT